MSFLKRNFSSTFPLINFTEYSLFLSKCVIIVLFILILCEQWKTNESLSRRKIHFCAHTKMSKEISYIVTFTCIDIACKISASQNFVTYKHVIDKNPN